MTDIQPDRQYRAFLDEGRFMLQRAEGTGAAFFYPRIAEPGTGDQGLEWIEASGEGVVYSTTVVRCKPPAADYNVALIDLVEGPRMMSRVVDLAPDQVTIGLKVRARIEPLDGVASVVFAPLEGGAS